MLMHLMIEEIMIDRKTKSVDTISIKFNRQLTEYLCLQERVLRKRHPFFGFKRGRIGICDSTMMEKM